MQTKSHTQYFNCAFNDIFQHFLNLLIQIQISTHEYNFF